MDTLPFTVSFGRSAPLSNWRTRRVTLIVYIGACLVWVMYGMSCYSNSYKFAMNENCYYRYSEKENCPLFESHIMRWNQAHCSITKPSFFFLFLFLFFHEMLSHYIRCEKSLLAKLTLPLVQENLHLSPTKLWIN